MTKIPVYKGKVTVSNQAGGAVEGSHVTEKAFYTSSEAIAAAKELGSDIERHYSTYSNMDYEVLEVTGWGLHDGTVYCNECQEKYPNNFAVRLFEDTPSFFPISCADCQKVIKSKFITRGK